MSELNSRKAGNKHEKSRYNCGEDIKKQDPVDQTIFDGKQICATYDAPSLQDTVQADENGVCPTGYTSCATESDTKWYDVYCLADIYDYPSKCPILAVDFIKVPKD